MNPTPRNVKTPSYLYTQRLLPPRVFVDGAIPRLTSFPAPRSKRMIYNDTGHKRIRASLDFVQSPQQMGLTKPFLYFFCPLS